MRLGLLAFTLLSISILSFGMTGSSFADVHNIPPLSVTTNSESFANGDTLVISGTIKNYNASSSIFANQGVTVQIVSPTGGLVDVEQVDSDDINSDGSFTFDSFITSAPLWKSSGDYTVKLQFGSIKGSTIITYTAGDEPVPVTPECGDDEMLQGDECVPIEVTPECGDDEMLQGDECVPIEVTPECGDDEMLVDGECEPIIDVPPVPECGKGTHFVDGICVPIVPDCPAGTTYDADSKVCVQDGGGCLVATAAYGTELAPQIQMLREVRDNTVLSTASGSAFMTGFNTVYYSFAPTIADWQRENPLFKESVKTFITPMVSTLSIMTLADNGSEIEVLGLGISVIALNLGMYIAAPALIGFKVHQHFKSRK